MIRWLKSLFAWREVSRAGTWRYEENAVTGRRRAFTIMGGYSPLNMIWLLDGKGMPLIDGMPAWRSRYRNQMPDGWYWS